MGAENVYLNPAVWLAYFPQVDAAEPASEAKPSLSLEEKTGILALTGIGHWDSAEGINWQQSQGFRCFHIYGKLRDGLSRREIETLQRALASGAEPPLLVTMDQEGGVVNRIGWDASMKRLSSYLLGSSGDPENARQAGELTGKLFRLFGINMNFAPFLDLHAYYPKRRFSDDPDVIAEYGTAFMEGLLAAGVGACAKHFPDGTSREAGDTHYQNVSVATEREELFVSERFQPLIDNGLPAIMVSHVIFESVDPGVPASLSRVWITDILKGEMEFDGLIVTDAFEMKAIEGLGITEEEAIIRACEAGVDLVLANPDTVRSALMKAVQSGRISEERLDESVRKVQAYTERFPVDTSSPEDRGMAEARILVDAETLYNQIVAP